jgi:hypothetical protein
MAAQPLCHTYLGDLKHAECDTARKHVPCSELLPSLFIKQDDIEKYMTQHDDHQYDCGDCDLPSTVSLSFLLWFMAN